MKRMAVFMLVMLVELTVAVVMILVPWDPILKSEKSGKGSRTAARRGEDGGKRVLNKAREDHQERVVAVREGLSFDARPEERTLPLVVRGVGYALLIVAAFAVSVALGAGIAVAMEYLVGWPDTWWL
jgi:hypothetical protein